MSLSPHHVPIPKVGRISLEDGELVVRRDNGEEFGRFMVGPDGLTYNGGEISNVQKGDPPKLRLGVLATEGHKGVGGLSLNVVRGDGRQEEIGMAMGSLDDDVQLNADGVPDQHRGKFVISLRSDTAGEPQPVAVWSQYRSAEKFGVRTFYMAAKRMLASLWVHAPAGEDVTPYCGAVTGGGGVPSRFRSDNARFVYNVQGDTPADAPIGRLVVYDTWVNGVPTADESQWRAVGVLQPTLV